MLISFLAQGIWKCVGTTGTKFPEVDLIDKEWNDYDEKVRIDHSPMYQNPHEQFPQAAVPVGISEFESRFERAHWYFILVTWIQVTPFIIWILQCPAVHCLSNQLPYSTEASAGKSKGHLYSSIKTQYLYITNDWSLKPLLDFACTHRMKSLTRV